MKTILMVVMVAAAAWAQSVSGGAWKGGGGARNADLSDVYVAPGGNDSNPCTMDQPCLTPQHATAVVRGMPGGKHVVTFRNGYYFLSSPWTFDGGDSGTAATAVIYQNYAGEVPVISGGRKIAGSWPVDGGITCGGSCTGYYIDLDADPSHSGHYVNFEALFYNGVRKSRPRLTDDASYSYVNGESCVTAASTNAADVACGCPSGGIDVDGDGDMDHCAWAQSSGVCSGNYKCFNTLNYTAGVPTQPHGLGLKDVEVLVFEKWTMGRMRLQSAASGAATFTGPLSVSDGNSGAMDGYRFLVENISPKDTGNAPVLKAGQWYLDRCPGCAYGVTTPALTWRLYYLAAAGENPNTAEIIVPGLDPANPYVLTANGLQHVQFRGLTFAHDNWMPNQYGMGDRQGMPIEKAAVSCNNCQYVGFDSVTVKQTQGWGVAFLADGNGDFSNCSTSSAKGCFFFANGAVYDTGAGGIRVGGDVRSPSNYGTSADSAANVPQNFRITNNVVSWVGQIQPSGIGPAIWIGQAHDGLVEHNDMSNTYSGCMEIGRKLNRLNNDQKGYSFTYGIWAQYNKCEYVGKGVTSDFGGFYLSTSIAANCPAYDDNVGPTALPGNTYCNHVLNNLVHDVTHNWPDKNAPVYGYGGNCLYADKGTTAAEFQNNLCYRISDSCIFVNRSDETSDTYNLWNLFQNNVFVDCGSGQSNRAGVANVAQAVRRGGTPPHSFTFRSNVVSFDATVNRVQASNGKWLCYANDGVTPAPCTDRFLFERNLYWNRVAGHSLANAFIKCHSTSCGSANYSCWDGNSGYYDCMDLGGWQAVGEDAGSVSENPAFSNYAGDDYRVTANLSGIGFQPADLSTVGRTNPVLQVPNNISESFPVRLLNRNSDWGTGDGNP